MSTVPDYLLSMIRREPPIEGLIVAKSTPVVSFGNFLTARIATLGINPSNREFEDQKGRLLSGGFQRLENLDSLKATSLASLTEAQVSDVIAACFSYFNKNSYSWFTPLEKVINPGLGASYFNESACHLDLVQWSTSSKWQALSLTTKEKLIENGKIHLQNQLLHSKILTVVVNGKSVWEALTLAGFGKPDEVGSLSFNAGKTPCKLLVLKNGAIKFVGWTSNLQSQQGANSDQFLQNLANWLQH